MGTSALPFGLLKSDTTMPRAGAQLLDKQWTEWHEKNRVVQRLTLYRTSRFGWVVCVLHIRNPGRGSTSNTARFYAISERGELCRVGLGPHVLETLEVYVTASRAKALDALLKLHQKGEEDANNVRDRISTRRARTTLARQW